MAFYNLSIFVVSEVLLLLSGSVTIYGVKDPYQWDILIFVQSNPPSVHVMTNDKRGENPSALVTKDHWTIHGIWPVIRGTLIPTFCNRKRGFNRRMINKIRRKLSAWWSPYNNLRDKESFWGHQWIKHGTCAPSLFPTEYYYFKQALKWMDEYKMDPILERSGIARGFQYPAFEIMDAIKAGIPAKPHVVCYKNDEDVFYLLEVWICFEKDLTMTDCPFITNCRGMVKY